jgi:hypothetical protein
MQTAPLRTGLALTREVIHWRAGKRARSERSPGRREISEVLEIAAAWAIEVASVVGIAEASEIAAAWATEVASVVGIAEASEIVVAWATGVVSAAGIAAG